jgi:hypothetical protein
MEDFYEEQKENEEPAQPETRLAVEEHAKRLGVAPSILAAVMQSQNWAAGKKITEAVFKDAVSAFLGAPMGRR